MKHIHSRGFGLMLIGVIILALLFSPGRSGDDLQAQSGGSLGYGSKLYGSISMENPLVTYSFNGADGDYVAISADSWTGTLDIQVELVAPNGVIVDRSVQNSRSDELLGASLSVFLPQTGAYILRISGENNTTGDYLLSVLGRVAATATPLVYDEAVDVAIPVNAAPQYFSFETEDCPTTVSIGEPSDGLPYAFPFLVKLRDQRGHTVALLRGGEQLEDWVTVEAQSGRYEVEVMAAEPSLVGSIRLLVTCSADNPNCPPGEADLNGAVVCAECPSVDMLVPNGGCPDLGLTVVQSPLAANHVTVSWTLMPGATGYAVYVTGLVEGGGEVYLTHAVWASGDPPQFTWILPEEGYVGYTFTLQVLVEDEVLCTQQAEARIESGEDEETQGVPCAIRADREGVPVRVGPGTERSIFRSLNPGIEYRVVGQAADGSGALWWELDKTQFTGHEAVISIWVAQADVVPVGDCSQVPQGEIPPVIPIPDDEHPGGWLPCGSCNTCGHPANECVTSPEGVCLWDPATCQNQQPGQPDGTPQCYAVSAAIDMGNCFGGGSASIVTQPNCQGTLYQAGTSIQAIASAEDSKCHVQFWSGCGASGSGSSVTFTPGGSCTVVAHMGY